MATTPSPIAAVQQLSSDREHIVHELARLSDADCRAPAQWAGIQRNVNFLLRAFSLHELDHLQHLQKLLAGRGRHFDEAELLLARAQALRGELVALLLSLSDAEFEADGPGENWSARQLVEHLREVDQRYATSIRTAVAAAREGASTTS